MTQRLIVFLIVAAVAACAAPPRTEPVADPAADAREWFYAREDGRASLLYGTPQSDDVAISMSCSEGAGRVTLAQGGLRAGGGIDIASGGARDILRGPGQPDELNGGVFMEAQASTDHVVLQAFRRTGTLSTGGSEALTATAAERASIEQFFAACARR